MQKGDRLLSSLPAALQHQGQVVCLRVGGHEGLQIFNRIDVPKQ